MSEAPKKPDDILDLVHIEHIIDGANPRFFSDLTKLLKTFFPIDRDEQRRLLQKIKTQWEKQ